MPRYIEKQPHKASCGPVAVINALKWLGKPATYRTHLKKCKKLGYPTNPAGTSRRLLSRFLRYFKIKYKRVTRPTLNDITKELDKGNAIILLYRTYSESGSWGHYTFINGYNDWGFKSKNALVPKFRPIIADFFRWSKRAKTDGWNKVPTMWVIYKGKK